MSAKLEYLTYMVNRAYGLINELQDRWKDMQAADTILINNINGKISIIDSLTQRIVTLENGGVVNRNLIDALASRIGVLEVIATIIPPKLWTITQTPSTPDETILYNDVLRWNSIVHNFSSTGDITYNATSNALTNISGSIMTLNILYSLTVQGFSEPNIIRHFETNIKKDSSNTEPVIKVIFPLPSQSGVIYSTIILSGTITVNPGQTFYAGTYIWDINCALALTHGENKLTITRTS